MNTASSFSMVGPSPGINTLVVVVGSVTWPEKATVGSTPTLPEILTESRPSVASLDGDELLLLPHPARTTAVATRATGRRRRRVRRRTDGPSDDDTDFSPYRGPPTSTASRDTPRRGHMPSRGPAPRPL